MKALFLDCIDKHVVHMLTGPKNLITKYSLGWVGILLSSCFPCTFSRCIIII